MAVESTEREITDSTSLRCKRILVHFELSDECIPAVEYGRTLAGAFGATLQFLHVVPEPLSAGWTAEMKTSELPAVQQAMEVEAEQWLDAVLPESEQERFSASLNVETGNVADEIVRCADEQAADLIVLTADDDSDTEAAGLVEAVLAKAKCSVFVVRRPG